MKRFRREVMNTGLTFEVCSPACVTSAVLKCNGIVPSLGSTSLCRALPVLTGPSVSSLLLRSAHCVL